MKRSSASTERLQMLLQKHEKGILRQFIFWMAEKHPDLDVQELSESNLIQILDKIGRKYAENASFLEEVLLKSKKVEGSEAWLDDILAKQLENVEVSEYHRGLYNGIGIARAILNGDMSPRLL